LLYRGWCYVAETDEKDRQDVADSFMGGGVKLTPKESVLRELVSKGAPFPGPPPVAADGGNGAAPLPPRTHVASPRQALADALRAIDGLTSLYTARRLKRGTKNGSGQPIRRRHSSSGRGSATGST